MKDKHILKDIKDIEIGDVLLDLDNNNVTVVNCDNIKDFEVLAYGQYLLGQVNIDKPAELKELQKLTLRNGEELIVFNGYALSRDYSISISEWEYANGKHLTKSHLDIMEIVECGEVVWNDGDSNYKTLCEVIEQVTKELAQLKESLTQANGKHSTLSPLNRASRDCWRRNW